MILPGYPEEVTGIFLTCKQFDILRADMGYHVIDP